MLSGVSIVCFAASYVVALCLEISRLFFRIRLRVAIMIGFAAAGLLAHTIFLVNEARLGVSNQSPPLSSWYHGCLVIAWLLAAIYLVAVVRQVRSAIGLLILPAVLLLIATAQIFPKQSQASGAEAHQMWSVVHGISLLLGTSSVVVGFLAGITYLAKSYLLKRKVLSTLAGRFPSLEILQLMTESCLLVSSLLLVVGVISGILLNLARRFHPGGTVAWSDPVVWTSGGLLLWLLAALVFNAVYKPARQGRKVAYLTVASFVFLALVLAVLTLVPSSHETRTSCLERTRSLGCI